MAPPARFVIEDEHLDELADSGVSSRDGVLVLIDACAAKPPGRSGRRAIAAVAVMTVVAGVAVGVTLNHAGSAATKRLEKPAPTADVRALVVGADQFDPRESWPSR